MVHGRRDTFETIPGRRRRSRPVGRGKMKVEDENADDEKDRKEADEVMFCRFSVGDLVQVWFKFSC